VVASLHLKPEQVLIWVLKSSYQSSLFLTCCFLWPPCRLLDPTRGEKESYTSSTNPHNFAPSPTKYINIAAQDRFKKSSTVFQKVTHEISTCHRICTYEIIVNGCIQVTMGTISVSWRVFPSIKVVPY